VDVARHERRIAINGYRIAGIDISGRRTLIKGSFCGVVFDRGCGHVFGLLMRVMTPVGPDVVR
jgi:hypothetical protein